MFAHARSASRCSRNFYFSSQTKSRKQLRIGRGPLSLKSGLQICSIVHGSREIAATAYAVAASKRSAALGARREIFNFWNFENRKAVALW